MSSVEEPSDMSKLWSERVIVGSEADEETLVVLTVCSNERRFRLALDSCRLCPLGAGPGQQISSGGKRRPPAWHKKIIVLPLECALHTSFLFQCGHIVIEGAVSHEITPCL